MENVDPMAPCVRVGTGGPKNCSVLYTTCDENAVKHSQCALSHSALIDCVLNHNKGAKRDK